MRKLKKWNKNKKVLGCILAASMLMLSITACGNSSGTTPSSQQTTQTQESSSSFAETESSSPAKNETETEKSEETVPIFGQITEIGSDSITIDLAQQMQPPEGEGTLQNGEDSNNGKITAIGEAGGPGEALSKESGKEPSGSPGEEPTGGSEEALSKESGKEPTGSPGEEPSGGSVEALSKESGKEPTGGPGEEPSGDHGEALSRDPGKAPSGDPGEALSRDPGKAPSDVPDGGHKMEINLTGETKVIPVTEETVITVNGETASLSDLSVGDTVTVITEEGVVTSIAAGQFGGRQGRSADSQESTAQ